MLSRFICRGPFEFLSMRAVQWDRRNDVMEQLMQTRQTPILKVTNGPTAPVLVLAESVEGSLLII